MILITRPHHLAIRTARWIEEMGLVPLVIPVLEVRYLNKNLVDNDYDAIIVTSQNAVYACCQLDWIKQKKIYAVGKATGDLLHQHGFKLLSLNEDNSGNLKTLAAHIIHEEKRGGRLLYLSGDHIAGDLEAMLHDYTVYRKIVYQTQAILELPFKSQKLIQEQVTCALFYSPRSALIFSQLAEQFDLDLGNKEAICISKNTASQLDEGKWEKIHTALAPQESEMQAILYSGL